MLGTQPVVHIYFAKSTVAVLAPPTFNMAFESRKCACLFDYIQTSTYGEIRMSLKGFKLNDLILSY